LKERESQAIVDSSSWHKSASLVHTILSEKGRSIVARAKQTHWSAGMEIIRALESSDDIYFLISGVCRAVYYSEKGTAVAFRTIKPGSYFGELGVLTDRSRISSILAETQATTVKLSRSDFKDLLLSEPQMALDLARNLAETVQSLTHRVIEHSTFSVEQRVCAEFARMAQDVPEKNGQPVNLSMITHEKLAELVGTNREVVTRILRSMRKAGLIDYDRRHLRLLQIDALRSGDWMLNA
jgi:CRP/FNR family transcriptional regulator, cyclic AMP receptor protein